MCSLARVLGVSLASMVLMVLGAADASASHYRLADIQLATQAESTALAAQGITDTKTLLERAATKKLRAALATASGLEAARLDALAQQCDLLRLEGVGPTMVLLLQAGGVAHIRALARQKPAALLGRLQKANAEHKLTEKMPEETMTAAWIAAAKKLPRILR